MVPPKTDPRWEKLICNVNEIPVTSLATKMLMTRLMLMNCTGDAARRKEAIESAYEFFVKNEAAMKDDIKLIFG